MDVLSNFFKVISWIFETIFKDISVEVVNKIVLRTFDDFFIIFFHVLLGVYFFSHPISLEFPLTFFSYTLLSVPSFCNFLKAF